MPVYMIRCGENGPVKIGVSAYPRGRLIDLQVAHHERLRIIRLIDGGEIIERSLHAYFADRLISGEWHDYCDEMLTKDFGARDLQIPEPTKRPGHYGEELLRVLGETTPTKLAAFLGIGASAVTQWHKVPARHIHRVAALTGIPAQEIRPDLFPADVVAA